MLFMYRAIFFLRHSNLSLTVNTAALSIACFAAESIGGRSGLFVIAFCSLWLVVSGVHFICSRGKRYRLDFLSHYVWHARERRRKCKDGPHAHHDSKAYRFRIARADGGKTLYWVPRIAGMTVLVSLYEFDDIVKLVPIGFVSIVLASFFVYECRAADRLEIRQVADHTYHIYYKSVTFALKLVEIGAESNSVRFASDDGRSLDLKFNQFLFPNDFVTCIAQMPPEFLKVRVVS